MVRAIFSATGDLSLATRALPLLRQEYENWTTGNPVVSLPRLFEIFSLLQFYFRF
jgi:hypothetical protein